MSCVLLRGLGVLWLGWFLRVFDCDNCDNCDCRLIAYAACLEGTDPVRLFDKRVNARRGLFTSSYLSD